MHEFSICQSLVDTIINETERQNLDTERVVSASVVVGKLRQIIPEFLQSAYEVLVKDTVAEGSKLIITQIPIKISCNKCSKESTLEEGIFICTHCASSDVELISGMELFLDSFEIEETK